MTTESSVPAERVRMRLGISPLSWVNEVLEDLGRGTSAETILTDAKAAGFEGVELSRVFPNDPMQLSRMLFSHGLGFVSGWYSGFLADRTVEEELAAVSKHAGLLRTCGANVMVYGECGHMVDDALDVPLARRLRLPAERFAAYGARLTVFAEAVKDEFDLKLAYHHHLMMAAETLDEIRAVMSNTGPAVGLLLDTGHAAAAGFDYARLIDEFGPRINHIHLKDVRAEVMAKVRNEAISFNDGVRLGMFTIPGDGGVDFGPVARFVGTGTYSGWLVVEAEQDPSKAPPAETVARAYRHVTENILARAAA